MNEPTAFTPPKQKTEGSFVSELIKFVLIAVVIVLPIRLFIAQPFIVSGASMEPTFQNGDYLIVDEISYRFNEPSRGDVVIFRFPKDPSKFFIKRIIGLPGETVKIESGAVNVTNDKHPDGFNLYEPYISAQTNNINPVKLEDNEYFVLGDNRQASSDSRIWGPLTDDLMVGRAFLRLFPLSQADIFPGIYDGITPVDIPLAS